MRTVTIFLILLAIGTAPVHAILPTSLSIEGTTLGVEDPNGPLIIGVLTTTTGFPLSDRIIFLDASTNGEFRGTISSVVGKAVTNKDGEFRFRPSSFAQGPYFRATYTGDGDYIGTESGVINVATLLEEAKAARVQDGPGNLNVVSTPTNADVYLNGLLAGKTDSILKGIPAGEYDVTLVRDGYVNATYPVLISSKKTVSLVVTLQRPIDASMSEFDAFVASMYEMDVVADVRSGPASFQLRQNTSDPAYIPHTVQVIDFSEARDTSYLVIVSPSDY